MLEEGDPMSVVAESVDEAAPKRGVAVAPGRADGKAEDGKFHAAVRTLQWRGGSLGRDDGLASPAVRRDRIHQLFTNQT
jgi:hypothetical protein